MVMVMELVVRGFGLVGLSSGDVTSLAFVSEACSKGMPLWRISMQTLLTSRPLQHKSNMIVDSIYFVSQALIQPVRLSLCLPLSIGWGRTSGQNPGYHSLARNQAVLKGNCDSTPNASITTPYTRRSSSPLSHRGRTRPQVHGAQSTKTGQAGIPSTVKRQKKQTKCNTRLFFKPLTPR